MRGRAAPTLDARARVSLLVWFLLGENGGKVKMVVGIAALSFASPSNVPQRVVINERSLSGALAPMLVLTPFCLDIPTS
jgi:hypothetical protein